MTGGIIDAYKIAREIWTIAKGKFNDVDVWTEGNELYVIITFSDNDTASEVSSRLEALIKWLLGK